MKVKDLMKELLNNNMNDDVFITDINTGMCYPLEDLIVLDEHKIGVYFDTENNDSYREEFPWNKN